MKVIIIAAPFALLAIGFVLFMREFGFYIDDIYPEDRKEGKEWE